MDDNVTVESPPIPDDYQQKVDDAANANRNLVDSLTNIDSWAKVAYQEMDRFNNILQLTQDVFQGFVSHLKDFGIAMKTTGSFTEQQVTQFGLLTTAVFGARKAFEGFGVGEMGKNFNTFGDQMQYMVNMITNSGGGIEQLASLAESAFGVKMPEAAKKSVETAKGFLASLTTSADNALRLQNGIIQLAAKTGTLGDVYKKIGNDLTGMNSILAEHQEMITQTMKATGLNQDQVEDWYTALGSIPGALDGVVHTGTEVNETMSLLTATIKASVGAGRQQDEVIRDMQNAFINYGIAGQDALNMTIRLSEISTDLKVPLDTVKSAFTEVTGELVHFADAGDAAVRMTDGIQRMMKAYVGGLMDAGMSAADASAATSMLEGSIGKLNIAQKAFISAQSGGPGGLLGGMQIDKMLRSGDFIGVMEKQKATMEKLMGPIITLDEVKTESDASRMQRQIALMKQGPLGSMVRSDQDAYKLFDLMAGKTQGKERTEAGKQFQDNFLGKTIDQGTKWQEKSYTQLTSIRNHIEAIRKQAEISNLRFLQRQFTAAANRFTTTTVAQKKAGENLQKNMRQGSIVGGNRAVDLNRQMREGGEIIDRSGSFVAGAVTDFGAWLKQLPDAFKASSNALYRTIMDFSKKANNTNQFQDLMDEIADARNKNAMRQFPRYSTPGQNVGEAARPTSSPPNAPTATQQSGRRAMTGTGSIPAPEVAVTQDGDTGRIRVNVFVKVEEKDLQGMAISPGNAR